MPKSCFSHMRNCVDMRKKSSEVMLGWGHEAGGRDEEEAVPGRAIALALSLLKTGAAVRLASFDGLRLLALIIGGREDAGL